MLTRPHRVEALGWWDLSADKPAFRNYYIALSEEAGLLWIYCEMPRSAEMHPRWFLQGVYA
jgi:protein ImuB